MNKGIVIFSCVLIASGVGLFVYQRSQKIKQTEKPNADDNYNKLLVNLGNIPAPSDNIVNVPFNSNKNTANFYTNNRVIIFEGTKQVGAGSYSDGGHTITMDGKTPITSGSVYGNLEKTI